MIIDSQKLADQLEAFVAHRDAMIPTMEYISHRMSADERDHIVKVLRSLAPTRPDPVLSKAIATAVHLIESEISRTEYQISVRSLDKMSVHALQETVAGWREQIKTLKAIRFAARNDETAAWPNEEIEPGQYLSVLDRLQPAWPLLKKALWDVVISENVNDGHYIKALDFTEKLYAAIRAAPSPSTAMTATPPAGEPVAWRLCERPHDIWRVTDVEPLPKAGRLIEPLYAATPSPDAAALREALDLLSLQWRGRAQAFSLMDKAAYVSSPLTLARADAYEECGNELKAALSVPAQPPEGERERIAGLITGLVNDAAIPFISVRDAYKVADTILSTRPATQPAETAAVVAHDREWQDISTAPKDGTRIEVKYLSDDPRLVRWSASRHGSGWHLVNYHSVVLINFEPTHWRHDTSATRKEGQIHD